MDRKAVKIFTAQDNLTAGIIMEALEKSQVPAYKKDLGNGAILNLYGGYSHAGEEIYVADADLEKAVEVLEGMGLEVEQIHD